MTRVNQLRGPGTVAGPRPRRRRASHGSDSNTTPTPRAAASPLPDPAGLYDDSLAVLLNDIDRDAQGFVERRVEPEISYPCSRNSPGLSREHSYLMAVSTMRAPPPRQDRSAPF